MSMGAGLISETLSLFHYLEQGNAFDRLGVSFGPYGFTGLSMGAHMASLAASTYRKPAALIPCLSPHSAANVFTSGVLRNWCAWDALEAQLKDYQTPEQRARGYVQLGIGA
jgi:hypothetical protein